MSRRAPIFLLLAGILALFLWWLRPASAPPERPPAPVAAAPRQARTYQPGARTPVPRAARVGPDGRAIAAGGSGAASGPQGDRGAAHPGAPADPAAPPTLTDRREDPPPDAGALREVLMARLDQVHDDIDACLGEWMAVDPDLAGEVSMGFQIDAQGLQQAFIVDHSDVPLGPLSCFSAAVAEVDWSGLTSDPLEVTFPFTFDANAAAAD